MASDFLFEVGVDTRQADAALKDFVKQTTTLLSKNGPTMNVKLGYSAALTNLKTFVTKANAVMDTTKPMNVTFNLKGASASLTRFMGTFAKHKIALGEFAAAMNKVDIAMANHGQWLDRQSQAFEKVTAATRIKNQELNAEVRLQRADATSASANTRAHQNLTTAMGSGTKAIQSQTGAMDFLNKVATNTLFKFIEYELAMQAFNGTIHVFAEGLKTAGNVEMEMVLQKLYGLGKATVDVNGALANASIIARQYGGDIVDVQQVIGLYTKQTRDLASATFLAAQAEKLHRVSGIETVEVYRTTQAILTQMGKSYSDLPRLYDQITYAALRLAVPLKAIGKNQEEGMRDLMEGLSESAATFRSVGLDEAGIIAIIGQQITATGEKGKEAAKGLSSMIAALQGGGPKRGVFEDFMKATDPKAFSDTEHFISAMAKNYEKIKQLYADGSLGVRPQQFESLQTFLSSLNKIKAAYLDIKANSAGALNSSTAEMMATFNAQAERMHTSLQGLGLAFGNAILPSATRFAHLLADNIFPYMEKMVPTILSITKALALLGAGFLIFQTYTKIWVSLTASMESFTVANQAATAWNFKNVESLRAEQAEVNRLQVAFDQLTAAENALNEKTRLGTALQDTFGLSMAETGAIARGGFSGGLAAAGNALTALGAKVMAAARPLMILYAAMSAFDGFDKDKNKGKAVQLMLEGPEKDWGMPRGGLASGVDAALSIPQRFIAGGDSEAQGRSGLANLLREKTPYGQKARDQYANLKKTKDPGRVHELASLLGQEVTDAPSRRQAQAEADKFQADLLAKSQMLNAFNQPQGDSSENRADYTSKVKDTGASATSKNASAIQEVKSMYQSFIEQKLLLAKADDDEIARQTNLGKIYGFTTANVKATNKAYADKVYQLKLAAGAARNELDDLKKQEAITSGKESSAKTGKDRLKFHNQLVGIHAAMTVVSGKAVELASRLEMVAAIGERRGFEVWLKADQNSRGIDTWQENFKGLSANNSNAIGASSKASTSTASYAAAQRDVAQLQAEYDVALKDPTKNKLADSMATLKGALDDARSKLEGFNKTMVDSKQKVDDLNTSTVDLVEKIGDSNFKGLSELLGIDAAQVTYLTGMETGMRNIRSEREKITQLNREGIDTAALKAQVDLEEQLLPLLEREKAIKGSAAYKRGESEIKNKSAGEKGLFDGMVDSAVSGKNATAASKALAEWTKTTVNAWFDTVAQKSLDKKFGIKSPDEKLKQIYDDATKEMLKASSETKISMDNFGGSVKSHVDAIVMFKQSTDAFVAAVAPKVNAGKTKNFISGEDYVNHPDTTVNGKGLMAELTRGLPGFSKSGSVTDVLTGANGASKAAPGSVIDLLFGANGVASLGGGSVGSIGAVGNQGIGAVGSILSAIGARQNSGKSGSGNTLSVAGSVAQDLQGLYAGSKMSQGASAAQMAAAGMSLGATIGAAYGPVGSAIGAGIGAVAGFAAGELIHHDNTQFMPDKYQAGFGTFVNNLNGTPGTYNGSYVMPDSQYNTGLGNKDQSAQLYDFLSNSSNKSKLTGQSLADYNQLLGLAGGSAEGLGIASQKDDTFTLHSGQQINVERYEALIASVNAIKSNTASIALAPIMSLNAFNSNGGASGNPYNQPGMNSAGFKAFQDTKFTSWSGVTSYSTPGVGSSGNLPSYPGQPVVQPGGGGGDVVLKLDGQIIARVVNAWNAQTQNRMNAA